MAEPDLDEDESADEDLLEPDAEEAEDEPQFIRDFISGERVRATPEEIDAVQVFCRRLVEDFGYDKVQIQTRPQFRVRKSPSDESGTYPVDIAVFKNNQKTEANLWIIIECKERTKEVGVRQLQIYMDMSPAEVGVWFNGDEHAYFRKVALKGGGWKYEPLPNIPKAGQRIDDIGKFRRKDLTAPHNLKAVFRDIRNHLAGLTTGITRDEALAQEIINILFCKIFDELNTGPDELVSFRCGTGEPVADVKTRTLATFQKVKEVYNDVFLPTDSIALDASSLAYIVGELQNYCITLAERDVIGDAFEVFIGPALKGAEGQFFTPRNVIRAAVSILDPQPGDMIIDPACGSGGFLIVALEHVWNRIAREGERRHLGATWVADEQRRVASRSIRGIEKDSFLAKVTKAYMAIIGDGRGGIFCENSLLPPTDWQAGTKGKIVLGEHDLLLTNPPFGAKIPIRGEPILSQYQLARKWRKFILPNGIDWVWTSTNKLSKKMPPQILFVERCLAMLKVGGRAAIVLPDGILGGAKLGYIAAFIKSKARIVALIDCPTETFSPNVTTKTHVVIVEKLDPAKKPGEYSVFMAVAKKVGHDRKGRPIFVDEDLDRVNDDLPTIASNYDRLVRQGESAAQTNLGFLVESKWLEDALLVRRYLPEYIEALKAIEASPHPKFSLGELKASLNTGANVGRSAYVSKGEAGRPYILVNSITVEGINFSDLKHIKSTDPSVASIVQPGDVVINRCGNEAGVASVIPPDLDGAIACGFAFVLRPKPGFDPHFIAGFLNSQLGRKQALRVSSGSVLDHITKADLQRFRIIYPKDDIRKPVADQLRQAADLRLQARQQLLDADKAIEKLL